MAGKLITGLVESNGKFIINHLNDNWQLAAVRNYLCLEVLIWVIVCVYLTSSSYNLSRILSRYVCIMSTGSSHAATASEKNIVPNAVGSVLILAVIMQITCIGSKTVWETGTDLWYVGDRLIEFLVLLQKVTWRWVKIICAWSTAMSRSRKHWGQIQDFWMEGTGYALGAEGVASEGCSHPHWGDEWGNAFPKTLTFWFRMVHFAFHLTHD